MSKHRVVVTSKINKKGSPWIGEFETRQEADEWIALQRAKGSKCPWGEVEKTVAVRENPYPGRDDAQLQGSEQVESLGETFTLYTYFLPDQFTVEVTEKSTPIEDIEKKIALTRSMLDFGQKIVAYVGHLNIEKNLSHAQKDQMMQSESIQLIMNNLVAGRIGNARSLINSYQVDGVTLTEQDKTQILDAIDSFLASKGLQA